LNKYDKSVTPAPSPEPVEPSVPDNIYRVGTAWKNGKCVNQVGAYSILGNAKKQADLHGMSVFDGNGKEVYKKASQFRVQCGSYNDINNAKNMVKKMKDMGFDALLMQYGTYVAQAGIFNDKANADKLYQKLKEKGLPATVIAM
jgi:cell division protein FtsN